MCIHSRSKCVAECKQLRALKHICVCVSGGLCLTVLELSTFLVLLGFRSLKRLLLTYIFRMFIYFFMYIMLKTVQLLQKLSVVLEIRVLLADDI